MARDVKPSSDRIALDLDDQHLLSQCEVHTYRARGPGGQKRNKTDSAVRLVHRPTGIVARSTESRSQHENRARALRRLRHTIALRMRLPVEPGDYRPSEIIEEVLASQPNLRINPRNPRYNHVVAEVLDVFDATNAHLSETAGLLGISMSHLTALFRRDAKLWVCANAIRAEFNRKPLHK